MKFCGYCNVFKDSGDFFKNCNTKDGLQARCKLCQRGLQKKKDLTGLTYYQQKHPEARILKFKICLRCNKTFTYLRTGAGGKRNFCSAKCSNDTKANKFYYSNLEKSRERSRKSAQKSRKDPRKLEKITARKRGGGAGFSPEEIASLFDSQGRKCPICGTSEPKNASGSAGKWCLDHCHKTGKVRGLLCGHCNSGIGMLKDSGNFLVKAAAYLGHFFEAGILSADTLRRVKPVDPFIERTVIGGLSAGVSVSGYDVRIREEVILKPGDFSLASTVERFKMTDNILGTVFNKSTWARRGLYVFSTIIEPSWEGVLTLEISNLGKEIITIAKGMPIAQVIFAFTNEPTEGYSGKYNRQEAGPQKARYENA